MPFSIFKPSGAEPKPFVVVNTARLPAEPMQVDYPVKQMTEDEEETSGRLVLLSIALVCFVVTLAIQIVGRYWVSIEAISGMSTLACFIGAVLVIRRKVSGSVGLLIWMAGLVLPVLFYLIWKGTQIPGSFVITTVLAVAAVDRFVEAFKLHFVMRLLADPFVSPGIRKERREWYQNRNKPAEIQRIIEELDKSGIPENVARLRKQELTALLKTPPNAVMVVTFASLVTLLPHILLSATISLVVTPVAAWFFFASGMPVTETAKVLWMAFKSFVNYERTAVAAPGVWHSPAGVCLWRVGMVFVAVFFLATSLLPSAHFYPVMYELAFGHAFPPEVGAALKLPGSPIWLLAAVEYLSGSFWMLWAIALGLIGSLLAPIVVLISALYASASGVLMPAYLALGAKDATERSR
jgi:hypothetical protein